MVTIAAVGLLFSVEPMRWTLPARHLFTNLDIHREGSVDYVMCMRVSLSEAEARDFVEDRFEKQNQIETIAYAFEARCPEDFWPKEFKSSTIGLVEDRDEEAVFRSGSGAVYENGYVYYWSNSM